MIIKCPECGRQVSEKAPSCPSCGVQIAGKITRCQNCGEIYFTEDGMCPACHQPATGASYRPVSPQPQQPQRPVAQPVQPTAQAAANGANDAAANGAPVPPKKSNKTVLVVSFIFAVIILGGLFYFYNRAQTDKEEEDYEFAMQSSDEEVLKSYLMRYEDAPEAHRDSINAHLQLLQMGDQEWTNAVMSNSRAQLQSYLDHNPNSIHRQEALNKIDSLDWLTAQKSEDPDAVEKYTTEHPDGRFIDDANLLLSKLKSTTVQSDEKAMVQSLFRQFFQSINSRDGSRLTSTVSMVLDNFLGKSNATSDDVLSFLNKLYKDDVTNMNWHIDQQSYKINKKEVAENEYEYSVTFNAKQDVSKGGATTTNTFRVSAVVSSDGKISNFGLTKLN